WLNQGKPDSAWFHQCDLINLIGTANGYDKFQAFSFKKGEIQRCTQEHMGLLRILPKIVFAQRKIDISYTLAI
ncbi:MAG: hypothetical protein AAGC54_17235, partial [Cyanobacteria bacterium P01_F01_bin.4]